MLSNATLVVIIALVFFIVSVVLAIVQNAIANPQLWALWALCVVWIIGALVGVRPP